MNWRKQQLRNKILAILPHFGKRKKICYFIPHRKKLKISC